VRACIGVGGWVLGSGEYAGGIVVGVGLVWGVGRTEMCVIGWVDELVDLRNEKQAVEGEARRDETKRNEMRCDEVRRVYLGRTWTGRAMSNEDGPHLHELAAGLRCRNRIGG
jgi:hypothetical protein